MLRVMERLPKLLLYLSLLGWRTKGFWVRTFLCWFAGLALLSNEEHSNHDKRFELRSAQPVSSELLIVDIPEREWLLASGLSSEFIKPRKTPEVNDGAYWQPELWYRLLKNILELDPKVIGIGFAFGPEQELSHLSEASRALFSDPRIIWSARLDSNGRVIVPPFASSLNTNVGLDNLRADDDGVVRHFSSPLVQIPHLGLLLGEILQKKSTKPRSFFQSPVLINFAGPAGRFKSVSFSDALDRKINAERIRGKVVLVGSLLRESDIYQTPVGRLSQTEIIANIADNTQGDKWPQRYPTLSYALAVSLLIFAAIWIFARYPQAVALVFFVLIGLIWAAASAWLFDALYIWLPVSSVLLSLAFTYIVFMSYQLSIKEQRAWRLEAEQKYLVEIEQLKTNFVSMMSHDLKTPIAKIQAITDRLLTSHAESSITIDLKNLRRANDDLHRYIQSILQVTKIEAKDFHIARDVTDLNESIEQVILSLNLLANEKNIQIIRELEPMFSIEVDSSLIREVIHNLVENAIKYTPNGGSVRIRSQEQGGYVTVTVTDTGPGISPEDQREIWHKFTRGKGTGETSGTGLGLYLVRYFVELHGGRVFLQSEVGHGTSVGFSIPVTSEGA